MSRSMDELERAVGPVGVVSLEQRGLLAPLSETTGGSVDRDRVEGALVGIAVGRALSSTSRRIRQRTGRRAGAGLLGHLGLTSRNCSSGADAQLALWSATAWRAGWRAPAELSDRIAGEIGRLRHPGRSIVLAAERRRHGAAWFEAGTPSFGNAALPRAVAVGAVLAGTSHVAVAAQADAAVTHAHPTATTAAAVIASLTSALITRPATADVGSIVDEALARFATVARPAQISSHASIDDLMELSTERTVNASLTLAIWALRDGGAPERVLADLAACGMSSTHLAVIGGLLGAAHGASRLPACWTEQVPLGRELRDAAVASVGPVSSDASVSGDGSASIWFLLDRSGSMQGLVDSVETGFTRFIDEQRARPGKAQITLVQFDDRDPHEVLVDHQPLDRVGTLRGRFQPRGMTPLYDAIGLMLDRAERDHAAPTDQLLVIFTDGLENASRSWDARRIFERINTLKQRGWTFVFLGANQDSYATGAGLGLDAGNVSNFGADDHGVSSAYTGLSRAVGEWRDKPSARRHVDRGRFWGDRKEAEDHLR